VVISWWLQEGEILTNWGRQPFTRHPEADEVQVGHLDETDRWWKCYFGGSFESRQRSYFAN
jgi:hypothetical protein